MSQLLRRTLLSGASAIALSFSAAALGWSVNWGGGERIEGDGKISREQRALSGFDGISLAGHIELKVRQSATPRVELEADGNLLPLVETRIVDGRGGKTLEIGVKRGYQVTSRQPLRVEVDLPQLRAVAIAGSGKAEVDNMKSEKLDFSVAGSGSVRAPRLDAGKVTMSIAGSGDIHAGGKAAEMSASVAGSGDVRARDLAAEEVKISISGSGDAEVQAARRLKVSIAGSGDVRYVGDPQVESSIAGSGKVRRL